MWDVRLLPLTEIFSKDIQADVQKVLNNTLSMQPQMENNLKIDLTKRPPWKVFDELQCKLHQLSMHPEQMPIDDIEKFLTEIQNCVMQHVLPDSMHKTIGTMTVHLLLLLRKYLSIYLFRFFLHFGRLNFFIRNYFYFIDSL